MEVRARVETGTEGAMAVSGFDQLGLDLRPVPQEGIRAWTQLGGHRPYYCCGRVFKLPSKSLRLYV